MNNEIIGEEKCKDVEKCSDHIPLSVVEIIVPCGVNSPSISRTITLLPGCRRPALMRSNKDVVAVAMGVAWCPVRASATWTL